MHWPYALSCNSLIFPTLLRVLRCVLVKKSSRTSSTRSPTALSLNTLIASVRQYIVVSYNSCLPTLLRVSDAYLWKSSRTSSTYRSDHPLAWHFSGLRSDILHCVLNHITLSLTLLRVLRCVPVKKSSYVFNVPSDRPLSDIRFSLGRRPVSCLMI
jgi:hypothetical protein